MSQPEATNILPSEVFQVWERQAETSEEFADEWREYAMMMAAFQAALERAPRTAEACDSVDIARLFITELEHLADTVNAVFSRGGIMEFASYMTAAKYGQNQRGMRSEL